MARKRPAKRTTSPKAKRATSPEQKPEPDAAAVDVYLAKLSERHRTIAEAFRKLVAKVTPQAVETLDWGLPVYKTSDGRVCYLKSFPTHVRIGFWHGADLPDPDSLLEGSGDTMRHVQLRRVDDVKSKAMRGLLKAAFTSE